MSSDLYVRYAVVPVGWKISLDFQVQADWLQQLGLSLKTFIYVCGPGSSNNKQVMRDVKEITVILNQSDFCSFA